MKAVLSEKGVAYEYFDITQSLAAMKAFLVLRDTCDAYQDIRGKRSIGIPTVVVEGVPYVLSGPDHAARLIEELDLR